MTYNELRERILPGYAYSAYSKGNNGDERSMKLNTGKGGALMLINEFEKKGASVELVAATIICHTDLGSYPLSRLTVIKSNEDKVQ